MDAWERYRELLRDEPLPAALVDLDALEHNLDLLLARLGDRVTLRLATKSVRCVSVLRRAIDRGEARIRGLMCYAAREAAFLVEQGLDDLLLAYPVARRDDAELLADLTSGGATIRAMVDDPLHVRLLRDAAQSRGVEIELCLDVDVSWRPLPSVHVGVRRSPVRSVDDALRVAAEARDGVRLSGVMAYEAQVAGLPDRPAGQPWMGPALRLIKRRSRALARDRRLQIVDALRRAGHPIALVNGGGTGSLAQTAHDGSVTEVTAGSGLYGPHLFDGYDDLPLRPAASFALAVVRSSDDGLVTCAGGGYVASGAAGTDRLPVPWLPEGLTTLALEGWGEVQTPLRWTTRRPGLGDPVIARHAKAGELAERFDTLLLFRDHTIVERAPTYRGQGRCFM